jgi:hypothetical protein
VSCVLLLAKLLHIVFTLLLLLLLPGICRGECAAEA